jgi:hypothetical protein
MRGIDLLRPPDAFNCNLTLVQSNLNRHFLSQVILLLILPLVMIREIKDVSTTL